MVTFINPHQTFAGLPFCSNISDLSAAIAIIGIPLATVYDITDDTPCAPAPDAIRKSSQKYSSMLNNYDFDVDGPLLADGSIRVVDCGNLTGDPARCDENRAQIARTIGRILGTGAIPVVIGGDDSIPIPFFHAYEKYGPVTVVQIDAHLDWRDEINGIKYGRSSTMRRASEMPWVERLIQVGLRGVGSAGAKEMADARSFGVHTITARQIHWHGIGEVLRLVPDKAPCLLTIDCDGLDPSIMPAVSAPSPGGLLYYHVIDLIQGLARKSNLIGMDLVEFVPSKDSNQIAGLTAARIIMNTIGALVRSRTGTIKSP